MKKIIATTIIATILLIVLITTATADENKNENQFEIKVEEKNGGDKDENENDNVMSPTISPTTSESPELEASVTSNPNTSKPKLA